MKGHGTEQITERKQVIKLNLRTTSVLKTYDKNTSSTEEFNESS